MQRVVCMLLLFSYLFTYMLENLGLESKTSTFSGQIMMIFITVLLVAGARLCLEEDGRQDNLEAAMEETTENIENNPPAYDDVLGLEEKICPS